MTVRRQLSRLVQLCHNAVRPLFLASFVTPTRYDAARRDVHFKAFSSGRWNTAAQLPSNQSYIACIKRPHHSSIAVFCFSTSRVLDTAGLGNLTERSENANKSLAWTTLHDTVPQSFGVMGFSGYIEVLPRGLALPCKQTIKVVNAFDYLKYCDFPIRTRYSMLHAPVALAPDAYLRNIRQAKVGGAKFKVSISLERNLKGTMTVWDTWTRDEATVQFDANGYLGSPERHEMPLISGS